MIEAPSVADPVASAGPAEEPAPVATATYEVAEALPPPSAPLVAAATVSEVKPATAPTIDTVGNVGAPSPGTGFGSETRNWTALQVSGVAAVKDERPLPGEVATKIYNRYVQSFTYPIPEKFSRDSFSTEGGSGGGGGGGGGGGSGSGGSTP